MIEIKDSYFKGPDGNRYFRRNAPVVEVSSHGEKKTPLTQANYLAVEGHFRYVFLDGKLRKTKPYEVAWSNYKRADVEAHVDYYFVVGGTARFTHRKAKDARLKLMKFYVNEGPLERILNNEAHTVRRKMKEEGKDARVCSSTWVVMSGELAERFETSASIEVSGTTSDGLSIMAQGGAEWRGSETITFAPGAVFAYGLHKVKEWNGDKVGEMDDDWQSFN